MIRGFIIKLALALAFSIFASGNVYAACQGKSKSACQSDKSCTYVSGYTKNDGTKVKGYCRSKGNPGTSNSGKSKSTKSEDSKSKSTKSKSSKDKSSKSSKDKKSSKTKKDSKKDKKKDSKSKDKK